MKVSAALGLVSVGCFAFAVSASSQSLAEIAKKEKARRAEISEAGNDTQVVDGHALRNVQSDKFTGGAGRGRNATLPEDARIFSRSRKAVSE